MHQFVLKFIISAVIAVFVATGQLNAQVVKDVLMSNMVEGLRNDYKTFSGCHLASKAIYAGKIGKSTKNESIRLRYGDAGICTTTTGGRVRSVTIVWDPAYIGTGVVRELNIYGKSSAYTSVDNLYSGTASKRGTLIATVLYSEDMTNTIKIEGDYSNIGICCSKASGSAYIEKIVVEWESADYEGTYVPSFSPFAGIYKDTQYITLEGSSLSNIYYTTNGDEPAAETAIPYDGTPIEIDRTTVVKAIAVNPVSGEESTVISGEYTINRAFSFSSADMTAMLGEGFIAPQLDNTYHEGVVTWSSSDEDVAIVDSDGRVTPKAAGTTSVAAVLSLPDAEPLTASYRFNVINAPDAPVGRAYYRRIKSDDDIVAGGIYLIVSETEPKKAFGQTKSSTNWISGEDLVAEGADVCYSDNAAECELILDERDGSPYFKSSDGLYVELNSSNQFVFTKTSSPKVSCRWTIDVTTPDNAIMTINKRVVRYRSMSNDFRTYTSGSTSESPVSLYRKMGALRVTTGGLDIDGQYYATYFTDVPFVVPANVTCATVSVEDGLLVVTPYEPGNVVPANTGLLVSAAVAGTYEYAVTAQRAVGHADNLLNGAVADMITSGDDCTFFRLAKPEGENLGFWWGAPEGGAFMLEAYKAYLAVPDDVSMSKGFSFDMSVIGVPSSIVEVPRTTVTPLTRKGCYDLTGRRISIPVKPGMYIVDGQKVVLK